MVFGKSHQSSTADEVWCFQCGAGYAAAVAECPECGVATVNKPPADPSQVGDPEFGQIEYDFHSYSAEFRSTLEGFLLRAEIHHAWHGATLIVGERDEGRVDELVADVEGSLRPALAEGTESVAYEISGWNDEQIGRLTDALESAKISYGFDADGDLEVAAGDEDRVEALLDEMEETGDSLEFGPGLDGVDPHDVLSRLFAASDRLARNPRDRRGLKDLGRYGEDIFMLALPFGFEASAWRLLLDQAGNLAGAVAGEATGDEISRIADEMRKAFRQYV